MAPPLHLASVAEVLPPVVEDRDVAPGRPELTLIIGGAGTDEEVSVEPVVVAREFHVPQHLLPRMRVGDTMYIGDAPVASRDYSATSPR